MLLRAIPLETLLIANLLKHPTVLPIKIKLASNHITAFYMTAPRCFTTLSADRRIQQFQLTKIKTKKELISIIHGTNDVTNYEDEYIPTAWISNPDIAVTTRELRNAMEDGVKGIKALSNTCGGFLTWSTGGNIRIWSVGSDGGPSAECTAQYRVPLDANRSDIIQNQLSVVEPLTLSSDLDKDTYPDGQLSLVTGDRFGIVQIVDILGANAVVAQSFHAHSSEVIDIACAPPASPVVGCSEHPRVFVTCSRDKTLQIFVNDDVATMSSTSKAWRLLQTLVTHKTSIVRVLVADVTGEYILSCANDRTVVIHRAIRADNGVEIVAYTSEKIISLKSTPLDMYLDRFNASYENSGNLLVSCNDKNVYVYQFPSGELTQFYKAGDYRTGSQALRSVSILRVPVSSFSSAELGSDNEISKISQIHQQQYLVTAGLDKSVRIYLHPEGGAPAACQWAHCESIAKLQIVSKPLVAARRKFSVAWTLASCGHDGCLILWELSILQSASHRSENSNDELADELGGLKQNRLARKVFSKADLARLARSSRSGVIANNNINSISITSAAGSPTRALAVAKPRLLRHSMSALSLDGSSSSSAPSSSLAKSSPKKKDKLTSNSSDNSVKGRRSLSTSAKALHVPALIKSDLQMSSTLPLPFQKPKQEQRVTQKPLLSVKSAVHRVPGSNIGSSGSEIKVTAVTAVKTENMADSLADGLVKFRLQYRVDPCFTASHEQPPGKPPQIPSAALDKLRKELRQTLYLLEKQKFSSS